MIHTVKGFSIVNGGEVFLECPCFLHDPTEKLAIRPFGKLDSSGSSDFSKLTVGIIFSQRGNPKNLQLKYINPFLLHWNKTANIKGKKTMLKPTRNPSYSGMANKLLADLV